MQLLHAQFGPFAERGVPDPIEGAVHMFCSPSEDALALDLARAAIPPSASATVLHHGMAECDFRSVLTSEI